MRRAVAGSLLAAALWIASGPPLRAWPLVMVALVPWITMALAETRPMRRVVYAGGLVYFLVCLQGLRLAHPLMFMPWMAMAAYLALTPLVFVLLLRQWQRGTHGRWLDPLAMRIPMAFTAAVIWVGIEWIRNYLMTGVSVLMVGHALADVPWMVQIADLGGSYAVSFVVVLVNAAIAEAMLARRSKTTPHPQPLTPNRGVGSRSSAISSILVAVVAVVATLGYGIATSGRELPTSGATIMLVGGHERTEYVQDPPRERAIYQAYARQTIAAMRDATGPVDAVVWPESMLTAGGPWITSGPSLVVPRSPYPDEDWSDVTADQLRTSIAGSQRYFNDTLGQLHVAMRSTDSARRLPAIIGGCALVKYDDRPRVYSGVVMIEPGLGVTRTYAKNHLVLFGETIPLVKSLPMVRDWIPPGMGLDRGTGGERFELEKITLLPNLCIETAVERVAVNHFRAMLSADPDRPLPDAIVTLTNDAWFNQTAVVEHHLRCAQLVAVATRRPILSAANGGPTAWIDSDGQIVERLTPGVDGVVLAKPDRDRRTSVYVRYGAIPAMLMGWIVIAAIAFNTLSRIPLFVRRVFRSKNTSPVDRSGSTERNES